MEEERSEEQKILILLDTNMIQQILGKDTAPHFEGLIEEVANISGTLAVSEITIFESLKAIIFDEKKRTAVTEFLEKYLVRYPLNADLMIEAARVHELYGSDEHCKPHRDKISTPDILIATTAMLTGAYILTCDPNDFPVPFFKEINRRIIYYTKSGRRKHIVVYILQPDSEAIVAGLNKIDPSIPQNAEFEG